MKIVAHLRLLHTGMHECPETEVTMERRALRGCTISIGADEENRVGIQHMRVGILHCFTTANDPQGRNVLPAYRTLAGTGG